MSMAEFYIEYGINPSNPAEMDAFLAMHRMHSPNDGGAATLPRPMMELHSPPASSSGSSSSAGSPSWPLSEVGLDNLAGQHGWYKMDTRRSMAPLASYKKHDMRLNFWLSTGTVGSYLDHPIQGKTQLFRRNITSLQQAAEIMNDPRSHTGIGYHTNESRRMVAPRGGGGAATGRGPCRYGARCGRADCWFDHTGATTAAEITGSPNSRGPCRYGTQCTRPNCWYDHPHV